MKKVWLHWLAYLKHHMQGCLCGCDLWTIGHEVVLEHVPSLPLSPYFFHQLVIPTFLEIKKKLMCLFVYFFDGLWPLEMIRVCHHQHQHSFLHLCSFVCLVFHFRHTPRSRKESWEQQFKALPQSLSHLIRRL